VFPWTLPRQFYLVPECRATNSAFAEPKKKRANNSPPVEFAFAQLFNVDTRNNRRVRASG
jgi:hypothetical protein